MKEDMDALEQERQDFIANQQSMRSKEPVSLQSILDRLDVTNRLLQTIIDNQVKAAPKGN